VAQSSACRFAKSRAGKKSPERLLASGFFGRQSCKKIRTFRKSSVTNLEKIVLLTVSNTNPRNPSATPCPCSHFAAIESAETNNDLFNISGDRKHALSPHHAARPQPRQCAEILPECAGLKEVRASTTDKANTRWCSCAPPKTRPAENRQGRGARWSELTYNGTRRNTARTAISATRLRGRRHLRDLRPPEENGITINRRRAMARWPSCARRICIRSSFCKRATRAAGRAVGLDAEHRTLVSLVESLRPVLDD